MANYATWNLYAYCVNNPVTYLDSSGHVAIAPYLPQIADIFEKIGEAILEVGRAVAAGVIAYMVGKEVFSILAPRYNKKRTSTRTIDYKKIRIPNPPSIPKPRINVPQIDVSGIRVSEINIPRIIVPNIPSIIPRANVQNNDSENEEIKHVYNSIKEAPQYPNGFKPKKHGTTKHKIKNGELLNKLKKVEKGKWYKVYKDGYDAVGNLISIHFFQSESGRVFNVKIKSGWSGN